MKVILFMLRYLCQFTPSEPKTVLINKGGASTSYQRQRVT